jgi:hypothetical protein
MHLRIIGDDFHFTAGPYHLLDGDVDGIGNFLEHMPAVGALVMDFMGAQKFTVYTLVGRGMEITMDEQGLHLSRVHSPERVVQLNDAAFACGGSIHQCFNQVVFPLVVHQFTDLQSILHDVDLLRSFRKTERCFPYFV